MSTEDKTIPREINEALIREWITKLRSGEYTQGRYALQRLYYNPDDGCETKTFCCLGVLQDIVGGGAWDITGANKAVLGERLYCDAAFITKGYGVESIRTVSMPTSAVRDALEYFSIDVRELVERNDAGATFTKIADHIEKNLNDWEAAMKKVTTSLDR